MPQPSTQPGEIPVLLKALADPIRMEVVQTLAGGERCVCDLTEALGLAQSRLSFHLKVMRQAGLITAREEGRWVYYKLAPQAFSQLRAWLTGLEDLSQERAEGCGQARPLQPASPAGGPGLRPWRRQRSEQ